MVEPKTGRKPGTSLLLSFLATGVGHIYCGRFGKGFLLYFLGLTCSALIPFLLLPPATWPRAAGVTLLVVATGIWVYGMVDAWRTARGMPNDYQRKDYNRWYVYAGLILLYVPFSIGQAFHMRATTVEAFHFGGTGMEPALHRGDRFIANKLAYRRDFPRVGDIVVFRSPERTGGVLVRRVAALPDDEVDVLEGQVSVNGSRLRWPTSAPAAPASQPGTAPAGQRQVPPGCVFVLCEDLSCQTDSRKFGPIPVATIIGRADWVYWPRVRCLRR